MATSDSTSANVPPEKKSRFPVWLWFALANVVVLCLVLWGVFFRDQAEDDPQIGRNEPTADRKEDDRDTAEKSNQSRSTAKGKLVEPKRGVVLITTRDSEGNEIGTGTGFLISPSGYVVTNYHVLRRSSSAIVEFLDHEKIEVQGVRGWDSRADLAILKLAKLPQQPTFLELDSSNERGSGMEVLAVGHPQQFKFTTTNGILNAVHRTSDLPDGMQRFMNSPNDHVWLISSAVIAKGSSGGPLLNRQHEVIGINTWVYGSFSVAIDVQHIVELLDRLPTETMPLAELTGPGEAFSRLHAEYSEKHKRFWEDIWKTEDEEERQKVIDARHPALEFLPRFCELADRYPTSPVAFQCLSYVCQISAQPYLPTRCAASIERASTSVLEKHVNVPELKDVLWEMKSTSQPAARDFLRNVSQKSAERDTRAVALFCVGVSCSSDSDQPKLREEAFAAFALVCSDYDDVVYHCRNPQHPTHHLATDAGECEYRLRHLSKESKAMEISGKGVDGKTLRLSDYRGKVVVLDFWGDWCAPCQAMLPNQRELVKRMKGKPFALLGINTDEQSELQALVNNKDVTWENWIDGRRGPISQKWHVSTIPAVFVLDHTGTIRYKHTGSLPAKQLNDWVDELLAKVPTDK